MANGIKLHFKSWMRNLNGGVGSVQDFERYDISSQNIQRCCCHIISGGKKTKAFDL